MKPTLKAEMANYRDFVSRRERAEVRRQFQEDLENYFEDAELRLPRETLRDRENPLEALASPKFRFNSKTLKFN